jgi:hypothetical protein
MAEYRWEELQARHRQVRRLLVEQGLGQRQPRTRPRSPEEEQVLIEMMVQRIERARAEGRLVKLGDRHWKLRLTPKGVQ